MILLTILANCVVLALDDRLPNGDRTPISIQLVSRLGRSADVSNAVVITSVRFQFGFDSKCNLTALQPFDDTLRPGYHTAA